MITSPFVTRAPLVVQTATRNLKLALVFAVASTFALAQDDDDGFSVDGQNLTQAHVCRADEDVEISGQGNNVTLTGPCRKVSLTGQGHVVTVDVVGTIEVSGMGNSVTWKTALKGKKPALSVTGVKNAVKQAK